jgi:hypothetical protein
MNTDAMLEEGFELNKTLRNLRDLRAVRQQSLAELMKFMESALLSGKLSGQRKYNRERNCLSKRAVATLELQATQLKRNLFYIMERERQILRRLSEIGKLGEQVDKANEGGDSSADSSAGIDESQEVALEEQSDTPADAVEAAS